MVVTTFCPSVASASALVFSASAFSSSFRGNSAERYWLPLSQNCPLAWVGSMFTQKRSSRSA